MTKARMAPPTAPPSDPFDFPSRTIQNSKKLKIHLAASKLFDNHQHQVPFKVVKLAIVCKRLPHWCWAYQIRALELFPLEDAAERLCTNPSQDRPASDGWRKRRTYDSENNNKNISTSEICQMHVHSLCNWAEYVQLAAPPHKAHGLDAIVRNLDSTSALL